MTTAHHTPHGFNAPLTSPEINRPLGELDAAIAATIATGSGGASTTLTAQAASGQKNMVVADRAGWLVGDAFWIGVPGGTFETGVIASGTGAGAGTLVAVANLANTYPIGTPVSKSPIEIVHARGVYPTLGARLADTGLGFLNAKAFGAKGDGTTDDTSALQAAIDALPGAAVNGLFIPPGTYRITAALVIPFTQYRAIYGAGRGLTTIRQDTSNVAVFTTSTEDTHSIRFGDMTLTYNAQQTSSNTAAIALNFKRASGAGIGNGWYYWKVRNLEITKAHIAIGIGGPGATGGLVVWNCEFDGIFTSAISMSLMKLVSPGGGGMPVNIVRHWTNIGGGQVPAGPAFEVVAAEMRFEGLDVEDWYGRLLYAFGGADITISGLHVERHNLNSTGAMFDVANQALVIDGARYDFSVTGGVAAILWAVGSGGSLHIRGARLTCTSITGTLLGLSVPSGAVTGSIEISGVVDDNNNVPLNAARSLVGTDAVHSAGGTGTVAQNRYYFTAFRVPGTIRVTTARFEVVVQSGGMGLGIYDEFGNRVADIGYQTVPAVGVQTFALLSPAILHPGKKYYAMILADNAVAAFAYRASASTAFALAARIASDQAGAIPPAPATVSIAASGGARQYAIEFF